MQPDAIRLPLPGKLAGWLHQVFEAAARFMACGQSRAPQTFLGEDLLRMVCLENAHAKKWCKLLILNKYFRSEVFCMIYSSERRRNEKRLVPVSSQPPNKSPVIPGSKP